MASYGVAVNPSGAGTSFNGMPELSRQIRTGDNGLVLVQPATSAERSTTVSNNFIISYTELVIERICYAGDLPIIDVNLLFRAHLPLSMRFILPNREDNPHKTPPYAGYPAKSGRKPAQDLTQS
jgi:hypothetical protein